MNSELPARIAARPVCVKRKLPIPFVTTVNPDGTGDFSEINPMQVMKAVKDHLCGLCGQRLEYWIAFLGGPYAAGENGAYTEPGMHEECAEWALKLCPYMARQKVPYRGKQQEPVEAEVVYGDKNTDGFTMVICRGFRAQVAHLEDGFPTILLSPTGVARRREFAYVNGKITEKEGD